MWAEACCARSTGRVARVGRGVLCTRDGVSGALGVGYPVRVGRTVYFDNNTAFVHTAPCAIVTIVGISNVPLAKLHCVMHAGYTYHSEQQVGHVGWST